MPDSLPRRSSLVSQTIKILQERMQKGDWSDYLPGERKLSEMLQVSRNTIRSALAELRRQGIVDPRQGVGNRIKLPRNRRRKQQGIVMDVGLLCGSPLERLRPTQTLWIDELRGMLSERGGRLHVFSGSQYFRRNPGMALTRLTTQHAHGCWILMLAGSLTQRWFEKQKLPCLVAGSVHPGLSLPFRDLDHPAISRHAAGTFLRLGHRKIALMIEQSKLAGDIDTEHGFTEGVRGTTHQGVEGRIYRHDGTVGGISNLLRRMMNEGQRPTAIFVANAHHYLTVATRLTQLGLRVPDDVSLISRDEDSFLSFMQPEPSRYVPNSHAMAKSLLRPVLDLLERNTTTQQGVRLVPEYVNAQTVGPPPRESR